MKLQKLTIHNIASIEDATIDFEARPLADSDVFLITGKTGAGKSTILDCICLALYGTTPRLKDTQMEGKLKDAGHEVGMKDPRQLMRRNTGEAFVSLTFIGSDGVHYEASWAISRSRKKPTGNLQNKSWQLSNLNTGHILTKDKDVEPEIKKAIGLDFNQFCRTTMLAQGEFTRFLNSKDDEKAEILEKITGVDIYSKIGMKVFATMSQKEQTWKDAQKLIEGIHTLTDAEVGERLSRLAELDAMYDETKKRKGNESEKRDWLKAEGEYARSVAEAKERQAAATEILGSEDFRCKEKLVKEWNSTIDARHWMAEAKKAADSREMQMKRLRLLAADFATLLGSHKAAAAEVDDIVAEMAKTQAFLDSEATKSPVYSKVQTVVSLIGNIRDGKKKMHIQESIANEEEKVLAQDLMPALELARATEKEAKDALDASEAEVKAMAEDVAALNLPQLRERRDAAKDMVRRISEAKERVSTLASVKAARETACRQLAARRAEIEEKKKSSAAMDAPIHDAEIRMTAKKEDYDRQSNTVSKFAKTLRANLHIGDTCPICRQRIENGIPHEEELAALVGGLEKAYKEAEQELKKLVDTKMVLDAEIKSETASYDRDAKKFNEDTSVAEAGQKALAACHDCGIDKADDNAAKVLDSIQEKTEESKAEVDRKIAEGEAKESETDKRRKDLDRRRKTIEKLTAKTGTAEKAVNDCRGKINTAKAIAASKQKEVSMAEQEVEAIVGTGEWQADWKLNPEAFAASLTAAAGRYDEAMKQKQALAGKLEKKRVCVENAAKTIAAIRKAMPSWDGTVTVTGNCVEDIMELANSIYASVTNAIGMLENTQNVLKENEDRLDAFLSSNEGITAERLVSLIGYTAADMERINATLDKERNAAAVGQTILDNALKQQAGHLKNKPEMDISDTMESLGEKIEADDKLLAETGEKKGAVSMELKLDSENKKRLGQLIEDAKEKKADYDKWARMNSLIGDATGKKFRKIAQSYVLSSLIYSANSYMKSLTDRYTLKVTPGTFVISIEDAYQGYASRAASTISGGESFLVSLSLALALSDIGQTLSVDTLFIDEGFGTLSGEPLQNAVNTLRTLHTKAGRHVGIISHVEELKERIPVQILVNQEGNNSSSTIKVIPE